MALEVGEGDYDVRVGQGLAYLGLLDVLAALHGDERLVRALQAVGDDGVHAGLEGVEAVAVCAVEMVERIFAPADVERVAVGEEGLAAQLLDIVADCGGPVRAQEGEVARLAEVHLDGDELAVKVDALKASGLHEAAQLDEQALPMGSHVGEIYF